MASDDSAQPQKPIAEMLKSFESANPSKTDDGVVQTSHPTQNGTLLDGTPSIPSMDAVNSIKETESDYHEASVADQSMYYPVNNCYGYYYPGSEMQYGDWNEQGYMAVTNGTDMQQATIQSNDTPLAYYMPGFQPGYDPYTSLIPGAVLGVDGMYLGQQPYVTSQVTPQSDGSFVSYQPLVGYGQEMISAYGYEAPLWNFNNANGHARNFTLPSATSRPKYPVKKVHPSKPASKLRGGSVEAKGSHLVLELSPRVEVPNSSIKSSNKTFASSKRYPSPAKSLLHTCQGKSDILSPNISNGTNNKENGRSSVATEKPAPRNKSVNGFGNTELLNDKNSGPRTNHSKNISTSTSYHSSVAGSELDDNCGSTSKTVVIKRDDYNLLDFPIKYEHALFFIIKSYSEDDIHKSIKYNVWTSTTNGNKKLDDAFQKAQEKIAERGPSSSKCPVYLFFSVNASGQFCGVAEKGSSNSLVFPDLPVCTSKDFSKQAWNGRWTRHDWNHSCEANPVGTFLCLDQNTSCHLPWCQGHVGALESNGWVYSAHCSFRIFTQVAAWNCLKGKWLFFSGDSNHVDTTRNLLILALGIPGHFLTTRRFDKKYQNPNNSSEEVRITNIFNGHSYENLNGWGMESFRDAGFQRLNRRYFSENTAPDVVIFNSGLHDGMHNTTLPQFIQIAEYTANFWSTMFKDLTLKNIKPPMMIYRTTIAAASEYRYWGTNPHKMEVYNAVLGEQLKLKGLLTKGRVVDNFDMTFPWHYDLRCSDGIHYGGLPTPAERTQGGITRHYFVDLMLVHVLLNAMCLK